MFSRNYLDGVSDVTFWDLCTALLIDSTVPIICSILPSLPWRGREQTLRMAVSIAGLIVWGFELQVSFFFCFFLSHFLSPLFCSFSPSISLFFCLSLFLSLSLSLCLSLSLAKFLNSYLAPVSCILSFVCKSVFLVQNSFKNRNPCRCPVCIYFVSTRNSFWTCDSVDLSIFRAQDDDVHTESRIYYFEELDTTSRFRLSFHFTKIVEVSVDSIRRVLSKMK